MQTWKEYNSEGKQMAEIKLNLENMANGEVYEDLQAELLKVANNIMDLNTEAKIKRSITIKIDYVPNESRDALDTSVQVTSKLAPRKRAETTTLVGRDPNTGFAVMNELQSGAPGQMFIDPDDSKLKTDVGEEVTDDGKIMRVVDYNANKKRKTN